MIKSSLTGIRSKGYNVIMINPPRDDYKDKEVRINGSSILVDWKSLKIVEPSNIDERLAGEKAIKKVLKRQKNIGTMTSSSI